MNPLSNQRRYSALLDMKSGFWASFIAQTGINALNYSISPNKGRNVAVVLRNFGLSYLNGVPFWTLSFVFKEGLVGLVRRSPASLQLQAPWGQTGAFLVNFMCGGLGSVFAVAFTHPLESLLYKTQRHRKQMAKSQTPLLERFGETALRISSHEGFSGLMNGLNVRTSRTFIFRGLCFGFFDTFKSDRSTLSLAQNLSTALLSVLASRLFTFPFNKIDFLRTNGHANGLGISPADSRLAVFRKVKSKYGLFGLFMDLRIEPKTVIGVSATLVFFESLKKSYSTDSSRQL